MVRPGGPNKIMTLSRSVNTVGPDPLIRSEAGASPMSFFNHFDRFYRTSKSGTEPDRLNKRHEVCVQRHREILRGKRVLDIASHDGRFSLAALHAGCAHITGIEARPHLVEAAQANFRFYGVEPSKYRFYLGDVFDILRQKEIEVDVVLLFGFFYHTSRHAELALLISKTGAKYIILDSIVLPKAFAEGMAIVKVKQEPTDVEGFGLEDGPLALVGIPSRSAVELIFHHHGFLSEEIDWTPYLQDSSGVEDYEKGTHATFLISRAGKLMKNTS
jgi:Methyltransferase domain